MFATDTEDTLYTTDSWVTAMGCADQYQICNPANQNCTELSGFYVVWADINKNNINLNKIQQNTALHLLNSTSGGDIYGIVYGRGAAALQAQKTIYFGIQIQLPNYQWQSEVSSWFAVSLARLQQTLVDYASGPPGILEDGVSIAPGNDYLCANQKVHAISGTSSFSVVGISAIVVLCLMIIAISFVLDKISDFIQQRWNRGGYRYKQWILDGKLQLQRLAYQRSGIGNWISLEKDIPITRPGELLRMPDEIEEGPLLAMQDFW